MRALRMIDSAMRVSALALHARWFGVSVLV
jgi:hypothetical protein